MYPHMSKFDLFLF